MIEVIAVTGSRCRSMAVVADESAAVIRPVVLTSTIRALITGNSGTVGRQVVAGNAAGVVGDGVGSMAAGGTEARRSDGTGSADPRMAHGAGCGGRTSGPRAVPPLPVVPADVFAGSDRGMRGSVVMTGFATSRQVTDRYIEAWVGGSGLTVAGFAVGQVGAGG